MAGLTADKTMSSSNGASAGLMALRIDLDRGERAVAFGHDFDRAAAAGGLDRADGQLGLDFLRFCCCARAPA